MVLNLATGVDTTAGSLSGTVATPSSGTNTVTINNGGAGTSFTVNQTNAAIFPGVIAGAGALTLGNLSTNRLTITGANTYTGATVINAGKDRAFSWLIFPFNLPADPAARTAVMKQCQIDKLDWKDH